MSPKKFNMIIETLTSGSIVTQKTCFIFPLSSYDKYFAVGLICLPLSQLDVTLGMNWLLSNCVFLNCFDKTVLFFGPTNSNDS